MLHVASSWSCTVDWGLVACREQTESHNVQNGFSHTRAVRSHCGYRPLSDVALWFWGFHCWTDDDLDPDYNKRWALFWAIVIYVTTVTSNFSCADIGTHTIVHGIVAMTFFDTSGLTQSVGFPTHIFPTGCHSRIVLIIFHFPTLPLLVMTPQIMYTWEWLSPWWSSEIHQGIPCLAF